MNSAKGDENTFFAHFKMRIGHEYSPYAFLDRRSEISSSMSDEMTGSKKAYSGTLSLRNLRRLWAI